MKVGCNAKRESKFTMNREDKLMKKYQSALLELKNFIDKTHKVEKQIKNKLKIIYELKNSKTFSNNGRNKENNFLCFSNFIKRYSGANYWEIAKSFDFKAEEEMKKICQKFFKFHLLLLFLLKYLCKIIINVFVAVIIGNRNFLGSRCRYLFHCLMFHG